MKEIVITEKTVKRELWILLACFIFAVLFDIAGIIKFGKPFTEVFMTIGYEIVIAAAVYVILAFFRLFIRLIFRIFRKH